MYKVSLKNCCCFFIKLQLQSPGEEARECGCATIAGLVSEPGAIQQLMKLDVVKILAPLMLDNSLDVRCKALGALR